MDQFICSVSRTELVGGKWLGFDQDGTPASTNELLCKVMLSWRNTPALFVGLRPDLDESWWLMMMRSLVGEAVTHSTQVTAVPCAECGHRLCARLL
jgi:phosphoenolpyruvate carboxylase|mmetsp:Transcript_52794/g.118531  ORF Transcript_52794/g.118531 Transcript_52794/m.118531 type:complete len:96 (+) Transcript_52794:896-1183(+)